MNLEPEGMRDVPTDPLVIGAGWPRTGTYSLAAALEMLGLGPCQHATSSATDPVLASSWLHVLQERPRDRAGWGAVVDGWGSLVDWPGSLVATTLSALLPGAKVILTARPGEAWYESFSATVLGKGQAAIDPTMTRMVQQCAELALGDEPWTRAGWVRAYERHVAEVRECVPPHRIIVYSVHEGWGVLCRFLGLPVPARPFPSLNDRASFSRSASEYLQRD